MPSPSAQTLTIPEAAAILGIHRDTAWRWAKAEKFPVPVLRINGAVRVCRAQLEAFIAGDAARAAS